MIPKFIHDHDRLRSIIDELDGYLKASRPPIDMNFAKLRWSLSRELAVHVAIERRALPDLFARTNTPDIYRSLDHSLDAELHEHMTQWTASAIDAAWDDYRAAAGNLLARLCHRMTFEEQKIFPALASTTA